MVNIRFIAPFVQWLIDVALVSAFLVFNWRPFTQILVKLGENKLR